MALSFKEWKEMAVTTYDVVSKDYNRKVYEAVVRNPNTKKMELVQLTLREVLTECEGSVFETQIRQAVMRSVYTGSSLEKEIRPVMDQFYG
jgi:NAD(P)H-dependent FMN reductase